MIKKLTTDFPDQTLDKGMINGCKGDRLYHFNFKGKKSEHVPSLFSFFTLKIQIPQTWFCSTRACSRQRLSSRPSNYLAATAEVRR